MNSKLIIYNYTLQGCKGILLYQGLSRPIMLKHPEHSEGCFLDKIGRGNLWSSNNLITRNWLMKSVVK